MRVTPARMSAYIVPQSRGDHLTALQVAGHPADILERLNLETAKKALNKVSMRDPTLFMPCTRPLRENASSWAEAVRV